MRDNHHILFDRNAWSSRPQARSLRENAGLIVPMERGIHEELHRNAPAVPLLGYHALTRLVRDFEVEDDYVSTLDSLQRTIELTATHPKAHRLEKSLANLAVQTLDEQRPYIQESAALRRIYVA